MTGMTLTMHTHPHCDLDASRLGPALRGQPISEILQLALPVMDGNQVRSVGQIFTIQPRDDGHVVIQGELGRLHAIGYGWSDGTLIVEGDVGRRFAARMSGGDVRLIGNAGDQTAAQMRGGTLEIHGHVGDDLGCPLWGRRSGMSGGIIHVIGDVGHYAGYRMRRGTLIIEGSGGDCLGCDLVAGTIVVTGRVTHVPGMGMRRGTIVMSRETSLGELRFTPRQPQRLPIVSILANDLQPRIPMVAAALRSTIDRSLGDLTCGGQGEIWLF